MDQDVDDFVGFCFMSEYSGRNNRFLTVFKC